MLNQRKLTVKGHPSIYKKTNRKLDIFFTLPENHHQKTPGILLFIGGFGVDPENHYFKKFHNHITTSHNLIPLQCNYFGYKYMPYGKYSNEVGKKVINTLKTLVENKIDYTKVIDHIIVKTYKDIFGIDKENKSNFEDLSLMQAIDNLTAVFELQKFLHLKNIKIDQDRIYIYGTSHGAYLSYLCNIFAPTLFSLLIDSSSYISPFINMDPRYRKITIETKNAKYTYNGKRFVSTLKIDEEITNLNFLYRKYCNKTKIESFHTTNDTYFSLQDKKKFCKNITNCNLNVINESKVDGIIFKSTNHSDINISKLLDFVLSKTISPKKKAKSFTDNKIISTSKYEYHFSYKEFSPELKIYPKTTENIYDT